MEDQPHPSDAGYENPPVGPNPAAPIGLGVILACLAGAMVYYLSGPMLMGQYGPVLLAGVVVSLPMRLIFKGVPHTTAIIIMTVALIAIAAGFVLAEKHIYTPFMLEMAIKRIFSLHGIIVFGFTGYFGYRIANRRGT